MSLPYPKYTGDARREFITEFRGVDRTDTAGEGGGKATFSDMVNGSTDAYPFAASRAARVLTTLDGTACALKGGEVLTRVEPPYLYYGEKKYDLALSPGEKQIVMMGTDLLVFPDGMYFNTVSKEYGSMETGTSGTDFETNSVSNPMYFTLESDTVGLPCGLTIENTTYGSVSPFYETANGLCLRATKLIHELPSTMENAPVSVIYGLRTFALYGGRLYYAYSGVFTKVQVSSYQYSYTGTSIVWRELPIESVWLPYVSAEEIGHEELGELWVGSEQIRIEKTEALNANSGSGTRFLGHSLFTCAECSIGTILGTEVEALKVSKVCGGKIVRKTLPALDHVVVQDNRLFGCRYGRQVDSGAETVINRFYASALGDYKAFEQFQGISTDSWYGDVGEEGAFTGACISPEGRPMFFKEDHAYVLYGDYPPYGYSRIDIRGVSEGAAKSLCYVDGVLYWKSRHEIMRYTGSSLAPISLPLGDISDVERVAAGSWKSKYYISMDGILYVYDTVRGLWAVEDTADAVDFAEVRGEFYILCTGGRMYTVDAKATEAMPWSLTSAPIGYGYPNRKYLSQLRVRIELAEGAELEKVEISLDGGDFTEKNVHVRFADENGRRTGTVLIPIRPRRCETFRYRLSGTGSYKLTGVTKVLEESGI